MSTKTLIIEIGIETIDDGGVPADFASVNFHRLREHMHPPQRKLVEGILSDAAEKLTRDDRAEARRGL